VTDRVRVVLVDDHEMVLDSMATALERRPVIEVVGRARSVDEAVGLIAGTETDVVVTDYNLGDGRGTTLVEYTTELDPPVPVLLLTGIDDRRGIEAALAAGCAGFVSKSQGMDQLVDTVLAVARGAAVFPAALLSSMLDAEPANVESGLTQRELEVLQLLAQARSVGEIAGELHLSMHTIRNHIKQILAKLGVHSQLQAVVLAVRRGYVEFA
jgi:DNA-binding NarL/FixJ family response regulator